MNLYGGDYSSLSIFDLGFTDPTLLETLSSPSIMFSSSPSSTVNNNNNNNNNKNKNNNISPPKHRHDGTSPLPLGMDWSPPPHVWDGRNSVWPHDFRAGWSYCVTVPSWTVLPNSRGSDPIVFYRVLIGIQSPQGVTTTRGILRRFSDFLKLSSDLKKAFPKKTLPPSPPKGLLKIKGRELIEERRHSLEDWMAKVLSDIDLSRSVPIAMFLELEAAARSSFHESNQNVSELNTPVSHDVPSNKFSKHSGDGAHTSSFASDLGNDSASETSDLGTQGRGMEPFIEHGQNAILHRYSTSPIEAIVKDELPENDDCRGSAKMVHGSQDRILLEKMFSRTEYGVIPKDKLDTNLSKVVGHHDDKVELLPEMDNLEITRQREWRLSSESLESATSSSRSGVNSDCWGENSLGISSSELLEAADEFKRKANPASLDAQFSHDMQIVLPSDGQHKMKRILSTMQQRLTTAKTDLDDLIARLNQELAVRQYLATKVKDLEVELETTKENGKENLQHAILTEKERFNQMQWDMEELRSKCMYMELKLKSEQDEKANLELKISSVAQENDTLQQELEVAREQLANLHRKHEESELKSKADVKLLVKEVKSLRTYQSELKQELSKLAKEKTELESILQKERRLREHAHAANSKLLHECEILRSRLEECSVNFLIEEENKLTLDSPSPSEAIDVLVTSDNRLSLLLAEAQLLAQDVENVIADASSGNDGSNTRITDDELRKMVTGVFIDNARLRKQVNSVIRCALISPDGSEKVEQDSLSKGTILSKLLER